MAAPLSFRGTVVKIFVVKYLEPAETRVAAVDAKTAVDVFLSRKLLPKGVVVQGAYPSNGVVPKEFGGTPPEAA